MPRLVVASNRTAPPGEERPGGLAVALARRAGRGGGRRLVRLVGRDPRRARPGGVRLVAEGAVDYALADLSEAEHEGYYLGYANRALWPVFHYRVDLAQLRRRRLRPPTRRSTAASAACSRRSCARATSSGSTTTTSC